MKFFFNNKFNQKLTGLFLHFTTFFLKSNFKGWLFIFKNIKFLKKLDLELNPLMYELEKKETNQTIISLKKEITTKNYFKGHKFTFSILSFFFYFFFLSFYTWQVFYFKTFFIEKYIK